MAESLRRHYKSISHGKDCLKTDRQRWSGGDMTRQTVPNTLRAAATGNARSPTVDNRVRRMNNDDAERSRVLVVRSAGWRNSSARYDGAIPLRHL